MIMKGSISQGVSVLDYLNSIFNTNVGPETKISINGGTMSIRDSIAYIVKKSRIENNTKTKISTIK
jgi:hypothetical protein